MCKGLSLVINLEIRSVSLLSAQNLLPDRGCNVAGGLSSLFFLCCDQMCSPNCVPKENFPSLNRFLSGTLLRQQKY